MKQISILSKKTRLKKLFTPRLPKGNRGKQRKTGGKRKILGNKRKESEAVENREKRVRTVGNRRNRGKQRREIGENGEIRENRRNKGETGKKDREEGRKCFLGAASFGNPKTLIFNFVHLE